MSAAEKKRQRQRPLPAANAFAYTIADGMAMGLPGKSTVYKLIKSGKLKTVQSQGSTHVDRRQRPRAAWRI